MADQDKPVSGQSTADAIEAESLRKAEEFIEQDEGATNRLIGWAGTIVTTIAVVMSLFHLYAAYEIVPTQELRYIHVAFVLLLAFLLFPMAAKFRDRIRWWDVFAGLACVDLVVPFDEDTPMRLIEAARPDVLVKGADYAEDQVVGGAQVKSWGGEVRLAQIADGYSTTAAISRMQDK